MRHNTKCANDEILTIATAFTTNELIYGRNIENICVWPYIRHNIVWNMVNGRFYGENDEISKNAIALTANEPKIRGK